MSAVLVHCDECNQRLSVRTEHFGRRVRCPQCQHVQRVTDPAQAVPMVAQDSTQHVSVEPSNVPFPPAVAAPLESPDVQHVVHAEQTEAAGAPIQRRKRFAWRVVAIASALVVVLVGGGLGVWFWMTSGTAEDLELVPSDAAGFVSIRPADALDSYWVKRLRKELGNGDFDNGIKKLNENLALFFDVKDVERISVYVDELTPDVQLADAVFIVLMKDAYDPDRLLKRFERTVNKDQETEKAELEGKRYYVTADGDVLYLHSTKIFVFGSEDGIKRSIEAVQAKGKGPLDEPKRLASRSSNHLVMGFNGKFTRTLHELLDGAWLDHNLRLVVKKIVGVDPEDLHHSQLAIALDKDVTIGVCGQYKSDKAAKTIVTTMEDHLEKSLDQLKDVEQRLEDREAPRSARKALQLARQMIGDIKIDRDGGRVEAEFRIKRELIEMMVDEMPSRERRTRPEGFNQAIEAREIEQNAVEEVRPARAHDRPGPGAGQIDRHPGLPIDEPATKRPTPAIDEPATKRPTPPIAEPPAKGPAPPRRP